MGVTAENRINAAHARGELEVDIHAVVRQQHHRLCTFAPCRVHRFLQQLFLDAEIPVSDKVTRVRDRHIRIGLTDDGDSHTVHRTHGVRREHLVPEICTAYVLREKLGASL